MLESCAFEGESLCGCIFDLRSEGDACIISAHMSFGSSGLSRGGAQRYTQLIGCESALRRVNHLAEEMGIDIGLLARGSSFAK